MLRYEQLWLYCTCTLVVLILGIPQIAFFLDIWLSIFVALIKFSFGK